MISLYVDQELYAETDQTGPAGIDAMIEEASAGFDLENYELAALRDYKAIHISPTNPDQDYTTVELMNTDQFSRRRYDLNWSPIDG